MGIAAEDVPFLPRGVRLHECKIRRGWFLLAPERAVKMDQIGAAILGAVDGVRTLDGVVGKLAQDFNAPVEQILGDVVKFLEDLRLKRMVELA